MRRIRLAKTEKRIKFNGDEYILEKKENAARKELYKKAIGQCCMPGCRFGYNLEVHHIVPLNKGGTDTFDNYIVLCSYCHRNSKLHRLSDEKRIALLTYKFFIEQEKIGACSDDYSDEEYFKKLRSIVYGFKDDSVSKKEEEENEQDK